MKSNNHHNNFGLLSPWTGSGNGEWLSMVILVLALSSFLFRPAQGTECTKKKYYVNIFGVPLNATVQCPMYFQWTVSEFCCYGKYDRFDQNPFCCYSDSYKLVFAVGVICLLLLSSSCAIFFCWMYNLPHHLLFIVTCGHFHLNNWMKKIDTGPYVDPSFYSGEPFWTRSDNINPLRPTPPRLFYPAAPANLKFRWDNMAGQMPLFIVASRQFTRNPYSARPLDRSIPSFMQGNNMNHGGMDASRRSSFSTFSESHNNQNGSKAYPLFDFHINMDEVEAAAELLEALKKIEEFKGDKAFPKIPALHPDIPEESIGSNTMIDQPQLHSSQPEQQIPQTHLETGKSNSNDNLSSNKTQSNMYNCSHHSDDEVQSFTSSGDSRDNTNNVKNTRQQSVEKEPQFSQSDETQRHNGSEFRGKSSHTLKDIQDKDKNDGQSIIKQLLERRAASAMPSTFKLVVDDEDRFRPKIPSNSHVCSMATSNSTGSHSDATTDNGSNSCTSSPKSTVANVTSTTSSNNNYSTLPKSASPNIINCDLKYEDPTPEIDMEGNPIKFIKRGATANIPRSRILFPTPPRTSVSLGEAERPREINRIDVPFALVPFSQQIDPEPSENLPNTIPNSDK